MLCFDLHEQRKCRSYSGMDFDTHPDSAWPHSHTSLGNVNNQVKVSIILTTDFLAYIDVGDRCWRRNEKFHHQVIKNCH